MEKPLKILCIPDTQCRSDVPLNHLTWVGEAICDYRPDVVVHLGDHFDFPSLSSHDKPGSKFFEGKRYVQDVQAGNEGMRLLLQPLKDLQKAQRDSKHKVYKPRLVFLMGNHSNRLQRAINNNPMLEGLMSYDHLDLKDWEVIPFLEPFILNGVVFCHYLTVGAMGRPAGSPAAILSKLHMSAVCGHQQGRQVAYSRRADGKNLCAIIAGSCYQHDEEYMSKLSNSYWRGIVVLHEVQDGCFDEMFVSLDYLKRKFG